MDQPKKTKYIYIKTKNGGDDLIACGWCFALLDSKDEYCWSCGCEIEEDGASYLEDLISESKENA